MNKNNTMINPSIVDLLKRVDNRYSLVVATSRRARQIIEGAEAYIDEKNEKPLTIAINEVNEGAIDVMEMDEVIKLEEGIDLLNEEIGKEEITGNTEGEEEGLI